MILAVSVLVGVEVELNRYCHVLFPPAGSPTTTTESINSVNIVRLALVVFLFPPLLAIMLWSRLNAKISQF